MIRFFVATGWQLGVSLLAFVETALEVTDPGTQTLGQLGNLSCPEEQHQETEHENDLAYAQTEQSCLDAVGENSSCQAPESLNITLAMVWSCMLVVPS